MQRCGNRYFVDAACGSIGLLVALACKGMAQAVPFLHDVVLSEPVAAGGAADGSGRKMA